jgi:RNA polymerase sigma-70 factor, ECF subfamily
LRNIIRDLENESSLDLVSLSLLGNEFAFKEIIRRHKKRIERTIFSMLGNSQGAEDIGQEVFIKFYYSMDKFKGDSEVITYLTRIAINLSINELKRRKRKIFNLDKYFNKIVSEEKREEKFIKNIEDKDIIEKAIDKLNPKIKAVIVLRFMNSYSIKEIAETLNIPCGTVLSRLARGQEKLMNILEQLAI